MAKRDPKLTSKIMKRIRGKDTGIEKALRAELTKRGLHYRLYSKDVFGHPDIVFLKCRVAIFCDSEFWHGYRFEENRDKLHTHLDYWIPKIERNIARDKEVNETLACQGYLVLRYWGKRIEEDVEGVADEIAEALARREEIFRLKETIAGRTTLCYIEKGDSYLFLHRTKKERDPNAGKWIGVGGHIEAGESPIACMKREIKEETGLEVKAYSYLGKVDFLNDLFPMERMYLYKVTAFEGELSSCDEGELKWVSKKMMMDLNLWDGDRIFLPLLDKEFDHPFQLDLHYRGDELLEAIGPYFPKERKAKKKKR